MTEKKERILKAALQLFAEQGYTATSTNKIAKTAKVSEALIYRHFSNKEGLLQAILAEGERKAKLMYADIILEENPKELLRKALEMPFNNPESDYDFWRLQFKLKWELDVSAGDKMKPLEIALKQAFEQLAYEQPELEAEYVIHFIEGLSGAVLRNTLRDKEKMKHFLLSKYQLL